MTTLWSELGKKRFLTCHDSGPPPQLKSRAERQRLVTNTVMFSNQHARGVDQVSMCILCVRVKINKRSFETFCVLIKLAPEIRNTSTATTNT